MSIFFQYYVLQKILSASYKSARMPGKIAIEYNQIRFRPPKQNGRFRRFSEWRYQFLGGKQWKTCCVLERMGLIQIQDIGERKVFITKEGAQYAAELKLQIVKSVCTFLLAIFSAIFGFWLGRL